MTLNCRGYLLDLTTPKVMGILNVTPDSFYDGGQFNNPSVLVTKVGQMISDGMDILDIGAMSSRPGAEIIPFEIELERLKEALDIIVPTFPDIIISIDTLRATIVSALVDYPIHIINDISGGNYDTNMIEVCANHKLGYIMMHMQGSPAVMQKDPTYDDVVFEIMVDLRNRVKQAQAKGLHNIAIDLGFGFGKSIDHNFSLLKNLGNFKFIGCPILVGISRKSMICKVLGASPANALNGTTALHMMALNNGASILRVHDIKEAQEVITLWKKLN